MSDITLPKGASEILSGLHDAERIGPNLYAAYWLHDRDNGASLMLFRDAHKAFSDLADAMGYTIARKDDAA